jgi:hypothetical protein
MKLAKGNRNQIVLLPRARFVSWVLLCNNSWNHGSFLRRLDPRPGRRAPERGPGVWYGNRGAARGKERNLPFSGPRGQCSIAWWQKVAHPPRLGPLLLPAPSCGNPGLGLSLLQAQSSSTCPPFGLRDQHAASWRFTSCAHYRFPGWLGTAALRLSGKYRRTRHGRPP